MKLLDPILTATFDLPSIDAKGFLPNLNPGTLSEIKEDTMPLYFCACFAGMTASPGESMAGTTSPAPLGPGTERIPLAYPGIPSIVPDGDCALLTPGILVIGGAIAALRPAAAAFMAS